MIIHWDNYEPFYLNGQSLVKFTSIDGSHIVFPIAKSIHRMNAVIEKHPDNKKLPKMKQHILKDVK